MVKRRKSSRKVSHTLVEALNVDEAEVQLGFETTGRPSGPAESIDFLDNRIPPGSGGVRHQDFPVAKLFPESIFQGDPELVQNGKGNGEGFGRTAHEDAVRRPEPVRTEPGHQPHERPVHGRTHHALR